MEDFDTSVDHFAGCEVSRGEGRGREACVYNFSARMSRLERPWFVS